MNTNVESVEALLQTMVGFDTINTKISGKPDAERPLADYLESLSQSLRLSTQRLSIGGESFNLLVSHQTDQSAPWILFESHMDTVTVDGMTIDPFGGKIENGKLYGRGACDTKGTGAAMLWALKQYAADPQQPNNIAILFTVDEEVSKTGIKTFEKEHLLQLNWKPAGAIIGEPTKLKPVVAHNGVVRWTITTRGVAAHSSEPSKGRSAIRSMMKVIETLETDYISQLSASHPMTGNAQCSINIIQGGVLVNIIPEECTITIDRRVVPGEVAEEVLPTIENVLNGLRETEPELAVKQDEPFMIDPPLDPAGGEAFAGLVCEVLSELNLPAEPEGVGYGTDGSTLAIAGIPTVVLGPGDIAQAHTCDEWIDVKELRLGVDVYLNVMKKEM